METDNQESTAVTFEWTLRGLKNIFESRYIIVLTWFPLLLTRYYSKGESKSKVTKSVRFGGGRWQVRALRRNTSPRL